MATAFKIDHSEYEETASASHAIHYYARWQGETGTLRVSTIERDGLMVLAEVYYWIEAENGEGYREAVCRIEAARNYMTNRYEARMAGPSWECKGGLAADDFLGALAVAREWLAYMETDAQIANNR